MFPRSVAPSAWSNPASEVTSTKAQCSGGVGGVGVLGSLVGETVEVGVAVLVVVGVTGTVGVSVGVAVGRAMLPEVAAVMSAALTTPSPLRSQAIVAA